MNRFLPYFLGISLCGVLLTSCSSSKQSIAQRKNDMQLSKDKSGECFVKLYDGTTEYFSTLKLVTGVLKTPYLLADGKKRFYADDIVAYQTKDYYAIAESLFSFDLVKSNLAVETLPGFAVRIAKGKLNIYSRKVRSGRTAADEFLFQEGNKGLIYVYSPEVMNNLIRKYPEALEFFNNYKSKIVKTKDLKNTAHIFNNGHIASSK